MHRARTLPMLLPMLLQHLVKEFFLIRIQDLEDAVIPSGVEMS